jgi:hypothetical protein
MQKLLAQGVRSAGQVERTSSRLRDRLYLLANLFPAVILLGACSAIAWADTDQTDSPPLDASANAAASRTPAVRQQIQAPGQACLRSAKLRL